MPTAPAKPARHILWPVFFNLGMAILFGFIGWNSPLLPRAKLTVSPKAELVGVTRDGQLAITVIGAEGANCKGPVQLWEIETGQLKASFLDGMPLGGYLVSTVVASRHAKVVAVNCNRSLKLFDADSGQAVKEIVAGEGAGNLKPVAVSAIGRYLAYQRTDPDRLIVRDLQTDKDLIAVPEGEEAAFAEDHDAVAISVKRAAANRHFSRIELWDLATHKQTRQLTEMQGGVRHMELLPDGTLAMVVGDYGSLYLGSQYDTPSELRLWHPNQQTDRIVPEVEAFAAFDSKLLCRGRSVDMRLIDRITSQTELTFRSPVFPELFALNPPTIVSSFGSRVEFWDVPPGRTLAWYLKHMWGVALFGSIALLQAIVYWYRSRADVPVDPSLAVPNASV